MPIRLVTAAFASVVLIAGVGAGSSAVGPSAEQAGRAFSGTVTYKELFEGTDRPSATVGVTGRGTFAAKLKPAAALLVRVLSALTTVPLADMAKGGTFVTRYDIDSANSYTGLVVGTFKVKRLGSLCLSYTVKHGKFQAGDHFIPSTGAYTTVGGTGESARVRLAGTHKLVDLSGSEVERLLVNGSTQAATAAPRPLSKTCQAVAKAR